MSYDILADSKGSVASIYSNNKSFHKYLLSDVIEDDNENNMPNRHASNMTKQNSNHHT